MTASQVLHLDHDTGEVAQARLALGGWETPRAGVAMAEDTNAILHDERTPATNRVSMPWRWVGDGCVADLRLTRPASLASLVAAKVTEPFGVRE